MTTASGPPATCFQPNADGALPTCTKVPGGTWQASYPDSGTGGTDISGIIVAFIIIGVVVSIATAAWRVSTARSMARRAGLNEDDATRMALFTKDGLDATYLASALRTPDGPKAAPPADPAPAGRSVADRLGELNGLHEQGLITDEEYAARRQALINEV